MCPRSLLVTGNRSYVYFCFCFRDRFGHGTVGAMYTFLYIDGNKCLDRKEEAVYS